MNRVCVTLYLIYKLRLESSVLAAENISHLVSNQVRTSSRDDHRLSCYLPHVTLSHE